MNKNKYTDFDIDGMNDLFYNILWSKETLYNDDDYKINLPDTIIFRNGGPSNWYFSNKESIIMKKNQSNLTIDEIEKTFIRKGSQHGVLGYYIYESIHEAYNDAGETDGTLETKSLLEYVDNDSLGIIVHKS